MKKIIITHYALLLLSILIFITSIVLSPYGFSYFGAVIFIVSLAIFIFVTGLIINKKEFYLLMIVGDKRLVTKDVSKKLGTSRLSFANESYMEEYLDITPGSVSVLGLMNDVENHVQLVIDEDVLKGEYVGCHPCINTSSLRVRTADLMEKIIPAMHHEAKIIQI